MELSGLYLCLALSEIQSMFIFGIIKRFRQSYLTANTCVRLMNVICLMEYGVMVVAYFHNHMKQESAFCAEVPKFHVSTHVVSPF